MGDQKKQNTYAVMKWLSDGNRKSIHHLTHIRDPAKPWNEYAVGDIVYCHYPKKPQGPDKDGSWKAEIIAVGDVSNPVLLTKQLSCRTVQHLFYPLPAWI